VHIAEQGSRGQHTYAEIGTLLAGVVERIEDLYNREDPSTDGYRTGFSDSTARPPAAAGRPRIVAGRPSMGKTAFALNVGENVALHLKLPVAVFSMEMGATQLAMRLIGSVGRLPSQHLRTGRLQPDDWERLSAALGRLNDAPILIDETPSLSAIECARARGG